MPKSLNKRRSMQQENRVASDLGGRPTPASGARPFAKGDVQVENHGLKVECKTTGGLSYSLTRKDLENLKMAAIREGGLDFAMQVEFRKGPNFMDRYAVIDWQTYLDMRSAAAELADIKWQLEKGITK